MALAVLEWIPLAPPPQWLRVVDLVWGRSKHKDFYAA